MTSIGPYDVDISACCSQTTIIETDNFNSTAFEEFYEDRNRSLKQGELVKDIDLSIVTNKETIVIKCSYICNYIRLMISAQDMKQMLGVDLLSPEMITVQHLIIYIFNNIGVFASDRIPFVNQIKLLHLGKRYALVDFDHGRNRTLLGDLNVSESPSFHLALSDIPSSPLHVISWKVIILNSFVHAEFMGSVTYAGAIVKKFKTVGSRKSSVVSNSETVTDISTFPSKISSKRENRLRRSIKKIFRL